jgi:hypothetical protein
MRLPWLGDYAKLVLDENDKIEENDKITTKLGQIITEEKRFKEFSIRFVNSELNISYFLNQKIFTQM